MTTYNTGNPIGSVDPRDLYDNAENLDSATNTTTTTEWVDRKGVRRKTWHGMQLEFDALADSGREVITNLGYFVPVPYAPGLSVTTPNFTVTGPDGIVYAAQPDIVPFVTGSWNPNQWYPIQNQNDRNELLIFSTIETATAAAATLPAGQQFVIFSDSTHGDRQTFNTVVGGSVSFIRYDDAVGEMYDYENSYEPGSLGLVVQARVSVKGFPWLARGDGSTDDTAAIRAADAYCFARGLELFFPGGVYRCTDGIDRKASWAGVIAAQMAPFPLTGDAKQFMRPGYKSRIPGSTLLFTGSGTKTATTQRSDMYASFKYCLRTSEVGQRIKDMAIVLDCDVYNAAGQLTQLGQENSADYAVGHYIDDAAQTVHDGVTVFGYFQVAGTVIRSVLGNDDPDYTIFNGGSTMGRHGLALIGSETNDGQDSGLSGTQAYGLDIFTLDHHSRAPDTAAVIYSGAASWRCLYIDGWTDAQRAKLNGHQFIGGCIRTYAIHPVEFDCASQINMYAVVHETSNYAGVPNAATKQWLASEFTFDVNLAGVRFSTDVGLMNALFGYKIQGQITVNACPGLAAGGGVIVAERTPASDGINWIKIGGASGGSGDPALQFGNGSILSSTAGWSLRCDISAADNFELRYGGTPVANIGTDGVASFKRIKYWPVSLLTVVDNAITMTQNYHIISATGSPTVLNINGGVEGEQLRLRKSGTGVVTISEGGNIVTPGTSVALTATSDSLLLMKVGSSWVVDGFSDNA